MKGQDVRALAANLRALEVGDRLFMIHCAQCHGKNAKGDKGIPDLTDNDWLYGGEPETILTSIRDGRQGVMTSNDYLGAEKIRALAHYVLSMSKRPHDTQLAQKGRDLWGDEAICRLCHGDDMRGNKMLGAPNLTDDVWLYGSSEAEIIKGITEGRNLPVEGRTQNQCPPKNFLDENKIRLLAAYVYRLGNR